MPSYCIWVWYIADERCLTNGYMEEIISCIPGMPPLRVKDMPSFFQVTESNWSYMAYFMSSEAQATLQADLVIFNTFDELEGPVLEALRNRLPPLYTLGPLLHAPENYHNEISQISESIWTEEMGCVKWLEDQDPCSVIYVSFGSQTVMSDEELVEFAWGLEASK